MDPSRIGLIFDIAGALLLSAEAIKVRNLERLVTRTQSLMARVAFVQISPDGGFAIGLGQSLSLGTERESVDRPPFERTEHGPWNQRMKLILGTLLASLVAGTGLVWLRLLLVARIGEGPTGQSALFALLLLLLGPISLFFLVVVLSSALGILLLLVEASVAAVAVFERKTADGTVGIIGALLLIAGFACQFVAAGPHAH